MYKTLFCLLMLMFFVNVDAQETKKSYCRCDTISVRCDTVDCSLIIYKPVNSFLSLTATRPDTNNKNIIFAAPAAFTAKNYKDIVGKFVGNDTIMENPTEKETGLCILNDEDIYMGDIKDSLLYYYNSIQSENTCSFQQMLLISNSQKIECKIFGKQKPTFRRALAIKNTRPCVVESLNRMNIEEFTDVMISEGFTDAIYMDMGTWSEGYFISKNGERTSIGPLKQNTRNQSNWLLFVGKSK